MNSTHRVRVLGTPVDALDMQRALDAVDAHVKRAGPPGCVVAINPEKVFAARHDETLRAFIENAALLIPDGIGVVLAARFLHRVAIKRVPGADLMQQICRQAAEKGHRLFLYGASEDVNRGAVDELRRRYPGIRIVGHQHGFVPPDQMAELVKAINDSRADILFVALGSPRQEQWIARHLPDLHVRLCFGIGGTLDTIVGKVKRAPRIWQQLGVEWLYRLICQPSRAKRQLVLPLFAWLVLAEKVRGRAVSRSRRFLTTNDTNRHE